MRSVLSSGVLAWALLFMQAICAVSLARSTDEVRIAGREYTRLSDWARRHNFYVRWTRKDESLELGNAECRIVLQIHSPEAQFDGVEVRLLFPLIQQGETVWISSMDVRTTFDPLLSPPRLRSGVRLRSICLDPGHGGKDPGNQIGGSQEKKLALLLSEELQSQLKRAGWKVSLTRTRDSFVELPDRPDIARRRKADLFVSIHFNSIASSASSVKGAEVYCLTPAGAPSTNAGGEGGGSGSFAGNRFNDENMFLAFQMQKNLTRKAQVEDRGVHRARFWVLRDAAMPAVLIEAGFLSNPSESRKILTPVYRRQLAGAIVDGLGAYKAVMERGL